MNDFSDIITRGELHLYADDTTAYVIGDSTDDVVLDLDRLSYLNMSALGARSTSELYTLENLKL